MRKLISIASIVLASAASAQDVEFPVESRIICKDGKPIAVQALAPMAPIVITVPIPADICKDAKPAAPARPASAPAARSARSA